MFMFSFIANIRAFENEINDSLVWNDIKKDNANEGM